MVEEDEDEEVKKMVEEDEDEEVKKMMMKMKMTFSSGYRSSEPLKADEPQSSNLYKINESSSL
jgi:hypothetical protein